MKTESDRKTAAARRSENKNFRRVPCMGGSRQHDEARDASVCDPTSAAAIMTAILEQSAIRPASDLRRYPPVSDLNVAARERSRLLERFADRLIVNSLLTRRLVSYQASKSTPFYRWLKYKEAFSPALVEYLFDCLDRRPQETVRVLDPFAGIGTALTCAAARGWRATGIELLPVGVSALKARFAADRVDVEAFRRVVSDLRRLDWTSPKADWRFPHIRITQKAFSPQTEADMSAYLRAVEDTTNPDIRFLLWFACLSILEEVSFTRKDGQYLRWDHRSGRTLGRRFDKGRIPSFREAIFHRLEQFERDLSSRQGNLLSQNAEIVQGSCLKVLPDLPSAHFDVILTSPPYCNRYDYTRTYALELAFANCGEDDIRGLRQTLLSATVENRSKRNDLSADYAQRGQAARFEAAARVCDGQPALQEALRQLRSARDRGELSNPNVPNLVENYFFEMALVVFEMARVLAPGGVVFMVNDNVRYHGEEIPVDLILADFAESAGLTVNRIWVLPRGKGNSSQQMGRWGRQELRKCIYQWSRASR